jgi:hypothetical protein
MTNLRYGPAPQHVRDTACEAFNAWLVWNGRDPQPTVTFEVNSEPQHISIISISQACELVWGCPDVVPAHVIDPLIKAGLPIRKRTYSACAQAILADIDPSRWTNNQLQGG